MLLGCVWSVIWLVWFRDDPVEAKWLSEAERDYILENRHPISVAQITTAMDETTESGTRNETGKPPQASLLSLIVSPGNVRFLCGGGAERGGDRFVVPD